MVLTKQKGSNSRDNVLAIGLCMPEYLQALKLIVGVGAYFALSELWLQIRESNSLLSGYEPDVIPYHPSAILLFVF